MADRWLVALVLVRFRHGLSEYEYYSMNSNQAADCLCSRREIERAAGNVLSRDIMRIISINMISQNYLAIYFHFLKYRFNYISYTHINPHTHTIHIINFITFIRIVVPNISVRLDLKKEYCLSTYLLILDF